MLTQILLCICAVICLYLSYRYAVGRPAGFPPGVYGEDVFSDFVEINFLHLNAIKSFKCLICPLL